MNTHDTTCFGDLRTYLAFLEKSGRLKRVCTPVHKDWELGCISRLVNESERDHTFAIMFDQVVDHAGPVLVNIYATEEMYATALGVPKSSVLETWARALVQPIPPVEVKHAPVHEVIETDDAIDLSAIPVPVWTPERDAGPYISAGNVITKDPETGIQNLANYRVQVRGPRHAGLFFGSKLQHGAIHYSKHCRRGQPMPVAIAIGVAPTINFAAAAKTAFGVDELGIAGSLAGTSVPVVKGHTVDLLVPATAECVIEGWVSPSERADEGPFGEALGYMNSAAPAPVVEITAITHRRNAIHHGYVQQLPPSEGHLVMRMGVLGPLWYYLTQQLKIDGLLDIAIPNSCAGASMLYVRLKRSHAGHASTIGRTLSRFNFGQKLIALFDEDIDIHDEDTCCWAFSSRVDPQNDITIIPDTRTFQYDPSTLARSGNSDSPPYDSSLMLVDATDKNRSLKVALAPSSLLNKVIENWDNYALPALTTRARLHLLTACDQGREGDLDCVCLGETSHDQ